jgi:hypothetical protein
VAMCFPYQFSTSALDEGEWSMPIYPQGIGPRYKLCRRLVPEPVWTLWRRESLLSLSVIELRPFGCPANSLVSIPSLLSRLDGLELRTVTSSSYESHSNLRMKKKKRFRVRLYSECRLSTGLYGLRTRRRRNEGLTPDKGKRFFSSPQHPDGLCSTPRLFPLE